MNQQFFLEHTMQMLAARQLEGHKHVAAQVPEITAPSMPNRKLEDHCSLSGDFSDNPYSPICVTVCR